MRPRAIALLLAILLLAACGGYPATTAAECQAWADGHPQYSVWFKAGSCWVYHGDDWTDYRNVVVPEGGR